MTPWTRYFCLQGLYLDYVLMVNGPVIFFIKKLIMVKPWGRHKSTHYLSLK